MSLKQKRKWNLNQGKNWTTTCPPNLLALDLLSGFSPQIKKPLSTTVSSNKSYWVVLMYMQLTGVKVCHQSYRIICWNKMVNKAKNTNKKFTKCKVFVLSFPLHFRLTCPSLEKILVVELKHGTKKCCRRPKLFLCPILLTVFASLH